MISFLINRNLYSKYDIYIILCNTENISLKHFVKYSIGAVEKQKLVYILNRDAAARLTISSPLEAHKSNTLVFHMVGVDVGFENPMFACLEMDYEVSTKLLYKCIIWKSFA